MKRNLIIGLFGLSAAVLLGCPVGFSQNGGPSCGNGGYECVTCYSNYDCPSGYVCENNYCEATTTDAGGCAVTGCPSGEVCSIVDAAAICVTSPSGRDASSDAPVITGCTSNASCADAGTGYLCLDGTCVSPSNQCTDTQQCPDSEDCVQGACVPACSDGACPTGYSCENGVCSGNPTPCGGADGGTTCATGETCVLQHCVPDCTPQPDGASSCPAGEVCVDGGCVPPSKPVFVCNVDGQYGDNQTGDCDVGSVCLHHACYLTCSPDGGTNACEKSQEFNECVSVTEPTADGGTGTFHVCGSSTTLGNQCSPTVQCPTSGDVCINGNCE